MPGSRRTVELQEQIDLFIDRAVELGHSAVEIDQLFARGRLRMSKARALLALRPVQRPADASLVTEYLREREMNGRQTRNVDEPKLWGGV